MPFAYGQTRVTGLPPRPDLALNRAWLNAHWHEYAGLWVALCYGHFLGARSSSDELVAWLVARYDYGRNLPGKYVLITVA